MQFIYGAIIGGFSLAYCLMSLFVPMQLIALEKAFQESKKAEWQEATESCKSIPESSSTVLTDEAGTAYCFSKGKLITSIANSKNK